MKHLARIVLLTILVSLIVVGTARSALDSPETQAQALFTQFIERARAFNPAVADLYADEAHIVSVRKYPDGRERTLEIRGIEYKPLIRQVMPIAKARGDINTYTDVSYRREGTRMRILATRYSALKQYSSPYSLLVGPNASGNWLIYEEHSSTKP